MKEGWTYKKLGEIAVSMADGPFGSNLKKEHYTNKREVRIIQLSNIGEDGWREENKKYTTFEHLKTIQRSEVTPGDIVIAKMMPAGRAIICPNNESKFVLSSDAVRVTLKDDLDNKFIYYSINSSSFRKQVYENVTGSGRVRTSLTKLRDCKIGVPSLSEQQRIVSRLDSAFAHIDELKANAEKQLSEARTLFQKALTKAMEPKEGWDEKTLNSIVKSNEVGIVRGLKEQDISYEYPYIKMGNITQFNKLDLTDIVFINATAEEVKKYQLIKGDFLFNTRNSKELVGKSCLFNEEGLYLYNNNILRIRFNNGIDSSFINYLFSADLVKKQLDKIKKGTTNVWAIYYRELKDIVLQIPPLSEQHRIVSRLDSLSAHVRELEEVLQKTIAECDALKQALLRKVFE